MQHKITKTLVAAAVTLGKPPLTAAVNRHGGDCTVVHLPDIGITGNTHFPFSDLNNVQIANLMENWLHEKGLDE